MNKKFKVRCPECGEEHWEEPASPIDRGKLTKGELYIHDIIMKAQYDLVMQEPIVTLKKLKGV